jgi:hypothetical protein
MERIMQPLTYVLGAQTLSLLTAAWAPNTSATYGSLIQRYFEFCEDQQPTPPSWKLRYDG